MWLWQTILEAFLQAKDRARSALVLKISLKTLGFKWCPDSFKFENLWIIQCVYHLLVLGHHC
jgi:hypothetical protein